MKTLLVGFCGKKGVGKSYYANELYNHYSDKKVIVDSFAAPLKLFVSSLLCDSLRLESVGTLLDFYQTLDKNKPIIWSYKKVSIRKFMQYIGTDIVRNKINKNIFVESLKSRYKLETLYPNKDIIYIVDDVRFENEAYFIVSNGGILINFVDPFSVSEDSHKSENVDLSNYITHNIYIKKNPIWTKFVLFKLKRIINNELDKSN